MNKTVKALALAAAMAVTPAALAQEKPGTPLPVRATHPVELAPNGPAGSSAWKLILVPAGILVAAFYLKRKKQGAPLAKPVSPKVISRTRIALRSELVVVEIEGARYMLGVTPSNISCVAELVTEEKEEEKPASVSARFDALLARAKAEPPVLRQEREPEEEAAPAQLTEGQAQGLAKWIGS
jgi:flagellar biogenesis protein FliO